MNKNLEKFISLKYSKNIIYNKTINQPDSDNIRDAGIESKFEIYDNSIKFEIPEDIQLFFKVAISDISILLENKIRLALIKVYTFDNKTFEARFLRVTHYPNTKT